MAADFAFTVDPLVYGYLDRLYEDDYNAASRIEDMLELLGKDHRDPRVRARAWDPGTGKWGFDVRGRDIHTVTWVVRTLDGQVEVEVLGIITNL